MALCELAEAVFRARALALLVLLQFTAVVDAQDQRVDVQLSANKVTIEEFVLLNVRATGINAEIDVSALEQDFIVRKRSSNSQLSIVNGQSTRVVEWLLELLPKRIGLLSIPPVKVGDTASRELTLLVEEPPQGASRELFITASVDNESPYVQSQVIYTLRVYQDATLLDGSLTELASDSVQVTQLGGDGNYQETVDGRTYTVLERRFALFPQKSGKVEIPAIMLQASIVVDPNKVPNARSRSKRVVRRTDPVTLDVRARPAGQAGSWWLPAKQVVLQAQWSETTDNIFIDQPLTRTIVLRADGVADAQLPEIPVPDIEGLSIYADAPEAVTSPGDDSVVSERRVSWAVIPQTAGELVFPEIRVNWFNTDTGQAEVAVLPAETLSVSAAADNTGEQNTASTVQATQAGSSGNNQGATQSTSGEAEATPASQTALLETQAQLASRQVTLSRWRMAAVAFALAWLLTGILALWLWRCNRDKSGSIDAGTSRSPGSGGSWVGRARSGAATALIGDACNGRDASAVARAVVSWGAFVWPDNPPTEMLAVARRLGSDELELMLKKLDAHQYSTAASKLSLDGLPAAFKRAVQASSNAAGQPRPGSALPEL